MLCSEESCLTKISPEVSITTKTVNEDCLGLTFFVLLVIGVILFMNMSYDTDIDDHRWEKSK